MRARWPAVAAFALLGLASCSSTVDSVGYNGAGGSGGMRLRPLSGPRTYPNALKEAQKTDKEIADKIFGMWSQLFHGEPSLESIYEPVGTDQARIKDTLHNDYRTEGIGLGMMIAVQLDKRTEFDRMWRYADAEMKHADGPRRGYFESRCDTVTGTTGCEDPYGESQMLTALIFAHDRWGSVTTLDYEAGAVDLLTVMRHKEDENGGVVDGVTNTFDATRALPFDLPLVGRKDISRPSIAMPAYYDLWAEATGDPFWTRAAVAARDYWKLVAHPETGLMPVRATFAGEPETYWEDFMSESYRAHINMALDWIWAKGDKDDHQWVVDEARRLLAFFSEKGIDDYGRSYTLEGMLKDGLRDPALVAVNGVTGMVAGTVASGDYVKAMFALSTPTGPARYYSGILGLTSLLILAGQYQVW